MKVFVIHYKKLAERKAHILAQFVKYNITDYEFVEIDRDDITEDYYRRFEKNLNKAAVAILSSHFYAFKEISEKYDDALILEDDIIFADNFMDIFNKYMKQVPDNYDMLFIGNGCNLHIESDKIIADKNIYEKCLTPTHWGGDGATRCVDSYVVTKKCATQICNYIDKLTNKINVNTDFFLNAVSRSKNFKVYWAEPTIVTQGSESGVFAQSYINNN